jgi:hypothetical protein
MTKIIVTKTAVRDIVREIFDNKDLGSVLIPESLEDNVITVNDVVDPSASITDTGHPNSKPQNKAELAVAIKTMLDDLPDDQAADIYDKLKGAVDVAREKDNDNPREKEMSEKDKVEEAVRLAVRKMVAEAWVKGPSGDEIWTDETPKKGKKAAPAAPTGPLPPVKKIPLGQRGGESQAWLDKGKKDLKKTFKLMKDDPADMDDEEVEPEPGTKRTYKSTAIGGMADVSGTSFQDIAKDLGFSVAGAKQAVDKALLKAQWLSKLEKEAPEELEILTLTSMNDYIKFLSKQGTLSSADVQLMKDHPEIVRELDGFREFLDKAIRKARKGGKLINPTGEDE